MKFIKYFLLLVVLSYQMTDTIATTFTVTNTNDAGAGSLRQAITDANGDPNAPHVIVFSVTGIIAPSTSPLPLISKSMTIDGNNSIIIDYNLLSSANQILFISTGGDNSIIKGLILKNCADGILVENVNNCSILNNVINNVHNAGIEVNNANGTIIKGNKIGTDETGTNLVPNPSANGISVQSSNNITIGGSNAGDGNVVSGNGKSGILLNNFNEASIKENLIGTDINGSLNFGNSYYGISIYYGTNITIGGALANDGNIISGNDNGGCLFNNTSIVTIKGNCIGTNKSGSVNLGNGDGLIIDWNSNNFTIGGNQSGDGNLISGNSTGIKLGGFAGSGIVVKGNKIGTNLSGTTSIANTIIGIEVNCDGVIIGGLISGDGNLISGNTNAVGIAISGSNTIVQGNLIGTDNSGTVALSNNFGIDINNGINNLIQENLISGNTGIGLSSSTSNNLTVSGNKIGTNINGTTPIGNADGIVIANSSSCQIGTTTEGNLISGNINSGILLESSVINSVVQNNKIGTNLTGTSSISNKIGITILYCDHLDIIGNVISGNAVVGMNLLSSSFVNIKTNLIGTDLTGKIGLGNNGDGLNIDQSNNINVGGSQPNEGNIISGNSKIGCRIGSSANSNIRGNKIGTDISGSYRIDNAEQGILLSLCNQLTIGGSNPTESNLISGNGMNGIYLTASSGSTISGVVIKGNKIGTDLSGTSSIGNLWNGIFLENASNIIIGGTQSGEGNLISGNATGIFIGNGSSNCSVIGNKIGTNITGTIAVANTTDGISLISSANAKIQNNLISGNGLNGVSISQSDGTIIQSNKIGTDISGTSAISNLANGIYISSSDNQTIGGAAYLLNNGFGNLISGNTSDGIHLETCTNVFIKGNFIGTDLNGANTVSNSGNGIYITGGSSSTIGTIQAGENNIISGNNQQGIYVFSTDIAQIKSNKIGTDITGNIDLGNVGDGIKVWSSTNIAIGGNQTNEGNLISGNNNCGIELNNNGNTNSIKGNKIGTNNSGNADLGNTLDGIKIGSGNYWIIGGTSPGDGNLISGNDHNGITHVDGGFNNFYGNKIGTDITGTIDLGNNNAGIELQYGQHHSIGGSQAGQGNLISGNDVCGIKLGVTFISTIIQGNKIGTDINGTNLITNPTGIELGTNTAQSFIGGTGPGEANIIAASGGVNGVNIHSIHNNPYSNSNLISGNLIYGFTKGINLNLTSGTPGNESKPAPSIYTNPAFDKETNSYILKGISQPNNIVEVFRSDGGPQNAIEYLGTVTADQNGNWTFSATTTKINDFFIATATDIAVSVYNGGPLNNTSEFSNLIGVSISCSACISAFAPIQGKKYVLTAWVKEDQAIVPLTYANSNITLFFTGANKNLGPFVPTGKIIDGWQRIEGTFVVPAGAVEIKLNLNNTGGSGNSFFDDIRIHPFDGNMKSFVYDPITQRLVAELDENNYATLYEYDEEGTLIRVKKETERGIMTIKETRGNLQKNQ